MELFDFAELIGAHIQFSGSYGDDNTYVNAYLHKGHNGARINRGLSVFGRNEQVNLEAAIEDLACELKGQVVWFDEQTYNVPDNLTHTPNYRPAKKKKRSA